MIYGNPDDTIVALATPAGRSAIAVLRLSGNRAIEIVNGLFPKKDLDKADSHTIHYGALVRSGETLDEVVLSLFKAPKSYTGEDTVEISSHGSMYIVQCITEALVAEGARPAKPGEYTMRAFMNGKMDLSQAEAVSDLINAESEASHKSALHQMRGGLSQRLADLREKLLNFSSLIELELDFAEEDVEFADRSEFAALMNDIHSALQLLIESFKTGNAMRQGVAVAIIGRPNAGKSTLLNALLQDERAIVSDIAGTTRDTVEDTINIDGITYRFIDTAGIRDTADEIERIGIDRALAAARKADIIIYLFDAADLSPDDVKRDIDRLKAEAPIILTANKTDTTDAKALEAFDSIGQSVRIAASTGDGLNDLRHELTERLALDTAGDYTAVTNIRHYEALKQCLTSVETVAETLRGSLTTDFLALDIRHALQHMGEITGEITNDEILGNIFSKFCIGK